MEFKGVYITRTFFRDVNLLTPHSITADVLCCDDVQGEVTRHTAGEEKTQISQKSLECDRGNFDNMSLLSTKTCPCNIQDFFSEEKKNENFIGKILFYFFFLTFLLKTYFVGTR